MRGALLAMYLLVVVACSRSPAATKPDFVEAAVAAPAVASSGPAQAPAPRVRIVEAPADESASALIRAKRLEAKAEGRALIVLVTATWCEPCKRLKAELASGRLDARYARTTFLTFDADRDADRLAAAGYSFRFIPFAALPGPTGSPADRTEADGAGSDAWRAILATLDRWQPT